MPRGRSRLGGGGGRFFGGIGGTGIYGLFGSVVQCSATDTSFYCSLTKLVNIIFMLMFLLFVLYIVYIFLIRGFLFRGRSKK
jgi:hypothetical protein